MKILDPSSATLTLAEVHTFLRNKPPQTPTKKRGAYEPVNLHGYNLIKRDFDLYLARSAPHVPLLPPAETFIANLLARFKEKNIVLTKGEALTLIDLGVGVKRPAATQTQSDGTEVAQESVEVKYEDGIFVDPDDRDDYTLLTAVVEEAESRFTDDQLTDILTILREEMPLSDARDQSFGARGNSTGIADRLSRDLSMPLSSPGSDGVDEEMIQDAGIEDEAAEDDALLHEAGYQRDTGERDIDGDD